jgi:hypothetical protein
MLAMLAMLAATDSHWRRMSATEVISQNAAFVTGPTA